MSEIDLELAAHFRELDAPSTAPCNQLTVEPPSKPVKVSTLLLLLAVPLLASCRKAEVRGRVLDPFGKGIPDAAIVVENTGFAATTDGAGSYAIRFVPGTFRVTIKKPSYTSAALPFSVTEASQVPAADTTLYPIPPKPGIYYVGSEGLLELPHGAVKETTVQTGPFQTNTTFAIGKIEQVKVLAGKAVFIDTTGEEHHLARALDRRGVFRTVASLATMGEERSSGFLKDTEEKVGEEGMILRKADVAGGQFGWIATVGLIPKEQSSPYYGFQVGDLPWFTFVGTFSNYGKSGSQLAYHVELWRDPVAGFVGLVSYPVRDADTPTGRVEHATYDPANGSLRFEAVLPAGQDASGATVHELHEFVGTLSDKGLAGNFARRSEGTARADTEQVVLPKQPFDALLAGFESIEAWQNVFPRPALPFRGPRK